MKSLLILLIFFTPFLLSQLITVNHLVYSELTSFEKYENFLVIFFDPNCPFCKRTFPEFEKAAHITKKRIASIEFGFVDLKVIPKLGVEANITKVPTILFFRRENKEIIKLDLYTYEEIVNYLMNKFHIHAIELKNLEEATKFFEESENVETIKIYNNITLF